MSTLHDPQAFADLVMGKNLIDLDLELLAWADPHDHAVAELVATLEAHLGDNPEARRALSKLSDAAGDYGTEGYNAGVRMGVAIEQMRRTLMVATEKERAS